MKTFIANVGDYHEFDTIKTILSKVLLLNVKYKEFTLMVGEGEEEEEATPYHAIFYVGKCPLKKEYVKEKDIRHWQTILV